ncbi:hypothetical protein [Streptomyces sp. NPDC059564]|uniref:hypothetical protein n=1 Tax=Streptomyces sp. NPDC059564 TaxID=3346865 RepID=UPI0036BED2B2
MISQPELEGEWPGGETAEPLAVPLAEPEPGMGSGRRPWAWALGGALAASAVWAGTLAVQDRFGDAGPPLAYRYGENLCEQAPLKAVGAIGGGFGAGTVTHGESPVLDWARCDHWAPSPEQRMVYQAELLVELHEKTDPGPEFGRRPERALALTPDNMPADAEQVPGLGEQALFSGYDQEPRLKVLDGGAVFSLTVQWFGGPEEQGRIDGDAVKSAMIEDMRALMTALRK